MTTMVDPHDMADFQDNYRNAAAYINACRANDATAMRTIRDNILCIDCFHESLANIGARLGDSRAVMAAASAAFEDLKREIDADL